MATSNAATHFSGAVVEELGGAIVAEEDAKVGAGVIDAACGFAAAAGEPDAEGDPGIGGVVRGGPVELDAHATFADEGSTARTGGPVPPIGEIGRIVEANAGFAGDEHAELVAHDPVLDHRRPQLDIVREQAGATAGLLRGIEIGVVGRVEIVRQNRRPASGLPDARDLIGGQHAVEPDGHFVLGARVGLRGGGVWSAAADFGQTRFDAPADDVGLKVGGAVDAVDPEFKIRGAFRSGGALGGGDDVEPSGIGVDQPAVTITVVFEVERAFRDGAGVGGIDGDDQAVVAAVDLEAFGGVGQVVGEQAIAARGRAGLHEEGDGHGVGGVQIAIAEDDLARVVAVMGEVGASSHAGYEHSPENFGRTLSANEGRSVDVVTIVRAGLGGIAHGVDDTRVRRSLVEFVIERRIQVPDGILVRGGTGVRSGSENMPTRKAVSRS